MGTQKNNPVNAEVDRLLREEVSEDKQDSFLRAAAAHLEWIKNPKVSDVRDFFSRWKGALEREVALRGQLGADY